MEGETGEQLGGGGKEEVEGQIEGAMKAGERWYNSTSPLVAFVQ